VTGRKRLMVILAAEALSVLLAVVIYRAAFYSPAASAVGHAPATAIELPLPSFDLTERSGDAVSLDDLKGKVWIADFIFTRCPGPCPEMTSRMYAIQEEMRDDPNWDSFRLVSITVDPDYDSPKVMTEWAKIALADKTHWLWLTGRREQVWQVIRDGFKLPVADNKKDETSPIIHSQKFVLVDRTGAIRGFYDGLNDAERASLVREARNLLEQ